MKPFNLNFDVQFCVPCARGAPYLNVPCKFKKIGYAFNVFVQNKLKLLLFCSGKRSDR